MKLASKSKFYTGIIILLILIFSYFIKIKVDSGSNYETQDTLLGLLIFHNPFVFLIYLTISAAFIITGIRKIRII